MGLPSINITFKELANSIIMRAVQGVVALAWVDGTASADAVYEIYDTSEIPEAFSTEQADACKLALSGTADGKPIKLLIFVFKTAISSAVLENYKWNVLVCPFDEASGHNTASTIVKDLRTNKKIKRLAVVLEPTTAPDSEGVVNLYIDGSRGAVSSTTIASNITEKAYGGTAGDDMDIYVSRLAGIIAGLPLTISPTYQVLDDITEIAPKLTKSQADTQIDAGKLVLYYDGEKTKIGRGVTSLTTTTSIPESYKKIKIVKVADTIYTDIKKTIEDNYIGRVSNSYANKLNLVASIQGYFDTLALQGILNPASEVAIDIVATRTYLQSKGIDVSAMTEADLRQADTDDKVFLSARLSIIDAMEDVTLEINI